MIRLNMKILFQFMPRAFDNSSTPRNAFQFHSHLKCIHTHTGTFVAFKLLKIFDDFQWLNKSKRRISSNVQTKGHCTGRQTRHLQTQQAIIMGLKLKAKLSTDHFLTAFNKYRLIRTALHQKTKTATVLKHRGISFIKRNMMALMMFVHKYMNRWRGHSLWPQ